MKAKTLGLVGVFFWFLVPWGFPEGFSVLSQYLDLSKPGRHWGEKKVWFFQKENGRIRVSSEEGKVYAELYFEDGVPQRATVGPLEFESQQGVLFTGGQPIPLDFLPPESPSVVFFKQKAGGLVFSYRLDVSVKEVSREVAFGLVDSGIWPEVRDTKFFFTEARLSGQVVLRQLWAKGFPWWLYEETPERRSWLISWR